MERFSARERAALERMGADWSPLPAGAPSPEVSEEDLTNAAVELEALVASMPALAPVVRAAGGVPYGTLRWLRHASPRLVDEQDRWLTPLEWIAEGRPLEDLVQVAEDIHSK